MCHSEIVGEISLGHCPRPHKRQNENDVMKRQAIFMELQSNGGTLLKISNGLYWKFTLWTSIRVIFSQAVTKQCCFVLTLKSPFFKSQSKQMFCVIKIFMVVVVTPKLHMQLIHGGLLPNSFKNSCAEIFTSNLVKFWPVWKKEHFYSSKIDRVRAFLINPTKISVVSLSNMGKRCLKQYHSHHECC